MLRETKAEGSDGGGGGLGGERVWVVNSNRHPNLLTPQPAATTVRSLSFGLSQHLPQKTMMDEGSYHNGIG
eukprot:gene951-biopygen9379